MLLIAKILVISRQLFNKLSKHEPTPPFLTDLRDQIASLRETLLKRIDKRLASSNASEDSIVESLAACCLAKGLSSDDAIQHFHQVRLDVMINQLDSSPENIPKSLRLFIHTLQTSKVLRSRQFTDVLHKLKSRPILSDPEIRNLDGLDIEILGRWVAPEINNFTPWINLSELSRSEGVESIKKWSSQAFERFASGCDDSLARSDDFAGIVELRAVTIEAWLSSWGSTITHRSEDVLERLREIFNNHIKRVLAAQAQAIYQVTGQIASTVASLENSNHSSLGSLWDTDLIVADYSNGAVGFKQTVIDRLLGRDDEVSAVIVKYEAWLSSIQEVSASIDDLRRLKWTDILVGGDDDEDEIDVNPRLNEKDPNSLAEALQSAVRKSYDALQTSFTHTFDSFGPSNKSEKATFLLRLIRLVRRDLPADFVADNFLFSENLVPKLQQLLAEDIASKNDSPSLLPSNAEKLKIVPGRSLWETVPVQPSPSAFKYLRKLIASMDDSGTDLWDPSTVQVLKEQLRKRLNKDLKSNLDELANLSNPAKPATKSDTNDDTSSNNKDKNKDSEEGEKGGDSNETSRVDILKDWKIQLLFDTAYLSSMLGSESQLESIIGHIRKSAEPAAEDVKAIQKAAAVYWTQTELLFGLLAVR